MQLQVAGYELEAVRSLHVCNIDIVVLQTFR